MPGYSVKAVGAPETLEYKKDNKLVSPFHDIPLWADKEKGLAYMVLEIPKGTKPKLEISKEDFLNPIKQDTKNEKLRYVGWNYPFNYGAFPQTWENPEYEHPDTKAKGSKVPFLVSSLGDNDPLDVVDISPSIGKTGEIRTVKVLGETDWKIVCIDINDPAADKINDIGDIEANLPGKLKEVFEFLRDYKTPDGKLPNTFAFNNELKDRKFALGIIEETFHDWEKLLAKGSSSIATANTTNEGSKDKISSEEAEKQLQGKL